MSLYTYKHIKKFTGKALYKYNMISNGEKIAVGLSGGKDSLSLMFFLNDRLSRVPVKYELFAIYIDPGFDDSFAHELAVYCNSAGYNLVVEKTNNGVLAHSKKNRENPCFLCSKLRRKRLFEIADELGCRKLALGHTKDDFIETLFLNMCYAGEIGTMLPYQKLFKGQFSIIRPFVFVDEDMIKNFVLENDIPVFKNLCPSANKSKRSEIKELLNNLYQSNKNIKGNLFTSMGKIKQDYLF